MEDGVREEVDALQKEYNWLLKEEVHIVLKELHSILGEACRRFPVQLSPGADNLVKPEKFLLSSPNGVQQVKCMVTLMADNICEADLTLRIHKQQPVAIQTKIYPDIPWRINQIQDAGNHMLQAYWLAESKDEDYQFKSAQQVIHLLDDIMESLNRGRTCLALPKKKTLEDLVKSPGMKAFRPALPNDTVLSFYVQAQKLVLAVYHLYVNQTQKIDIASRFQVECSVPWLNEILVLFTVALQLCQQLRDKVSVFMQYDAETKFLVEETPLLDLHPQTEDSDLVALAPPLSPALAPALAQPILPTPVDNCSLLPGVETAGRNLPIFPPPMSAVFDATPSLL